MKKFISLILILSLITLISCTDQSSQIYFEHSTDVSNQSEESENTSSDEDALESTLSGTLKISSMYGQEDFTGWWPLAQGFMDLHPDVTITANDNAVELLGTEQDLTAMEHYISDLRINLLSGDAPDLIFDDSGVSSDLALSGLLVDLNELIESDNTFVEEDFYMNVIKSGEIGGVLASIPTTFSGTSVRFNTDMLQSIGADVSSMDTVDYSFISENYYKVLQTQEFSELEYINRGGYYGKYLFESQEFYSCFDFENLTVDFDTENFKNYLEFSKGYDASLELFALGGGTEKILEDETYFMEYIPLYPSNSGLLLEESDHASNALPLVSSSGEYFVSTGWSMSIPKSAENAQLAWEFIKYCIYESETVATYTSVDKIGHWDGDRFFGGLPINKNNLEKYLKVSLIGNPDEYVQNLTQHVNESLTLPIKSSGAFMPLSNAKSQIILDYYTELLTTEECIRAMQDRAEIYFAEIK